jgi:hypothetical protein
MKALHRLRSVLVRPSVAAFISLLLLASFATAGSLTPPGAVGETMVRLSTIWGVIASGSYDSSALTANENGSLIRILKAVNDNTVWASASNNAYYLGSGNVGIGDSTPEALFEVSGTASLSQLLVGGVAFAADMASNLDFDDFLNGMTLDASTTVAMSGFNFAFTGTGNVGIGDSTPEVTFEAVGAASASRYYIGGSSTAGMSYSAGSLGATYLLHDGSSYVNVFPTLATMYGANGSSTTRIRTNAFTAGTPLIDFHIYDGVAGSRAEFYEDRFTFDAGASEESPDDLLIDDAGIAVGTDAAAAPGYSFGLSRSTGMYRPSTGGIGFSVTGTERVRIDSVGNVGIATTTPITQLHVPGRVPTTTFGSASAGDGPRGIHVQGRYAYIVSLVDSTLRIFDISNPASPVSVGTAPTGSGPRDVYVQGNYAYVANGSAATMQVFDVSNPSNPVSIGSAAASDTVPDNIYAQGRYVYMTNLDISVGANGTLDIFDVADPSSPVRVGSVDAGVNPSDVVVSGRYVVTVGGSTIRVFDASNPAAPYQVGSAATAAANPQGIYVQGRYAYVTTGSGGSLQIFDISNPAAPSSVGSVSTGSVATGVYVQGRYAYVVTTGPLLVIVNVSDPTAPVSIGSVSTGASPFEVFAQGRYIYVPSVGGDVLQVFDTGGAYVQQFEAGGIEAGTLALRTNLQVANDADIRGGAVIGRSLLVSGPFSVASSISGYRSFTVNAEGHASLSGNFELSGTASISGATTLRGVTYIWPSSQGGAGTYLQNDGLGNLTWATVSGGGGDGSLEVRELGVYDDTAIASLSFNPAHFALAASGSEDVFISLDWGNGGPASLSENETVTGIWDFQNGASFSNIEITSIASVSQLFVNGAGIAANMASDLDFDDFLNSMTLDANLIIASAGYTVNWEPYFTSSIAPSVDDTYALGTPTLRWRDLYVGPGTIHVGTGGSEGCFRYNGGNLQYSNNCSTYNNFTAAAAGGWTDEGTVVRLTTASDNVGIGTSTPTTKFQVSGNASVSSVFEVNSGIGTGNAIKVGQGNSTPTVPNYTWSDDSDTGFSTDFQGAEDRMYVITGGVIRALFSDDGDIQIGGTIGTGTAPAARLLVLGQAGSNYVAQFASSSGSVSVGVNKMGALMMGVSGNFGSGVSRPYNSIDDDLLQGAAPGRAEVASLNDLFSNGDVEIDGILDIGGAASISGNFEVGPGNSSGRQIKVTQGNNTPGVPNFTWSEDPDTGFSTDFQGDDGNLFFINNGTISAALDENGRLQVGGTITTGVAPPATLTVVGEGTTPMFSVASSSGVYTPIYVNVKGGVMIGAQTAQLSNTQAFNSIDLQPYQGTKDRSEMDASNDLFIGGDLEVEGIVDFGTNASIGTAAGGTLEVGSAVNSGVIKVAQGNLTVGTPEYTWGGDSDTGFSNDFQDDGHLYVITNGTMRAFWDDDGDYQIGGTYDINLEPTATLTVFGQAGAHNIAQFSSSSSSLHSLILGPNRAMILGGGAYNANDDFHQINNDTTNNNPERGEIGGLADLYIAGDFEVEGISDFGGNTSVSGGNLEVTGTSSMLRVEGSTNSYFTGIEVQNLNGGLSADTALSLYNSNDDYAGLQIKSAGSSYYLTAASILYSSDDLILMPNGGVPSGGTNSLDFYTGGYNEAQRRMRINSSGNIGIGTTTMNSKLSFGTSFVGTPLLHLYDGGGAGNYGFGIQSSELQTFIPTAAHLSWNGGGALQTSGTSELMRLMGSGNLGIAATSPEARLEVGGSILASGSGNIYLGTGLLQVSGTTAAAYNRYGTGTTGHLLSGQSDLLVSDDLEVNGVLYADNGIETTTISANSFSGGSFSGTSLSVSGGIGGAGASFSGNIQVGGVAKLSNGTAAAPAYTFTNGMNTGMYRNGDEIAFSVTGTQRATITSAGYVNAIVGFSVNSTTGSAISCGNDQYIENITVTGGIITAGNCQSDIDTDTDLAEAFFAMDDDLEPGDLVVAHATGGMDFGVVGPSADSQQAVIRSTAAYQGSVIGVYSTRPSIYMGKDLASGSSGEVIPVALAGRVPTKVTGTVKVGDRIVASDIPGVGMKATKPGMTVGIALEPTNLVASGSVQTVIVLISPSYWAPSVADTLAGNELDMESEHPGLFAAIISQFADILGIEFGEGSVKADSIEAQELCVGAVCVTEEQFMEVFGSGSGAPSDEEPSDEPAFEDAPTKDTPAEESPAEELPAEEPSDEPAPEELTDAEQSTTDPNNGSSSEPLSETSPE